MIVNKTILIIQGEIKPEAKAGDPAHQCFTSSQMNALNRYDHWQLTKHFDIYFFNVSLGLVGFNDKIRIKRVLFNKRLGSIDIKLIINNLYNKLRKINKSAKLVVMLDSQLRLYFMFNLMVRAEIKNRVWIGSESIGLQRKELRLLAAETIN
jgi:hypothetical protein